MHDAGREPIAVLWASEPAVYGRYGYGLANPVLGSDGGWQRQCAETPAVRSTPTLRLRLVAGRRLEADRRRLRHRRGPAGRGVRPHRALVESAGHRPARGCGRVVARCGAWWWRTATASGATRAPRPSSPSATTRAGQGLGARGVSGRPGRARRPLPLPVRPGPDGQHRSCGTCRSTIRCCTGCRDPRRSEARSETTRCTSACRPAESPSARGPMPPTSTSCST